MREIVGSERVTVREGIVAQSSIRFAAGAGVVAAALLIVGPNPAQAVADKGGSGHHKNDSRANGSSGQRGNANRGASNGVKDNLDVSYIGGVATAAPRAGSDYSGQSATAFRAPRVVFGNGRTPGMQDPRDASEDGLSYDDLSSAEAVPDVPAVPEAIEINIPSLPPPLPPLERMRAALLNGEFGIGTTDLVTDPLAGAAGLFLIPAIGVVLGYRQARAAQSVRETLRS